jgi:membrane protease YdiL (CAAX protease family)
MAASLALAFVRFEPRWLPVFWVWAPINLLTTCVSEEAFFRGLVQNEVQGGLSRVLERRPPHAVVVSAALFGLAHGPADGSTTVLEDGKPRPIVAFVPVSLAEPAAATPARAAWLRDVAP